MIASKPARDKARLSMSLLAGAASGALFVVLESSFARFTGASPREQVLGSWVALLASVCLFAPLGEALKLLALSPAVRLGWVHGPKSTTRHAAALALGFASIEAASYLRVASVAALPVSRALLALPMHVFAASAWAYALGRDRVSETGSRRGFALVWLGAVALRGLYEHLLYGRGLASIFATLPLLAATAAVAYLVGRPLLTQAPPSIPSLHRGFLPALPPPPSMRAVRAALRRAESPATLRWILFGSLVTTGVMIASVTGTVLSAQRLGVDFSVVDEGQVTSTVPLLLLGTSVLAAFPVSGFLLARASGTESVLEPAMGAGLAIAAALLLLGLAAPVAVVFGLAFAPVAFVLACAGAWVGAS